MVSTLLISARFSIAVMFVILKKIENLDGFIINDQRLKRFIIDKNKLKEKDVNQFLIVFFNRFFLNSIKTATLYYHFARKNSQEVERKKRDLILAMILCKIIIYNFQNLENWKKARNVESEVFFPFPPLSIF